MATRYDLRRSYGVGGELPEDRTVVDTSPSWVLGIVPLAKPNSFSRRTMASTGAQIDGVGLRGAPSVIRDVTWMDTSSNKGNPTTSLSARCQTTNLLDPAVVLPGDWIFAWMLDNVEDHRRILQRFLRGEPCNGWADGLKFVGRAHSVNRSLTQDPGGVKSTYGVLQAIGFSELDTSMFYDYNLATEAATNHTKISEFMAQIGLEFTVWVSQQALSENSLIDNGDAVLPVLVDTIVGKGIRDRISEPLQDTMRAIRERSGGAASDVEKIALTAQRDKSAPYSYLVPAHAGKVLGRDPLDGTKGGGGEGVFGYGDVLDMLIGVQQYDPDSNPHQPTMYPTNIDHGKSTASRHFTDQKIKGTFLPVEPSFVNVPLWSLLQKYLNPTVNEMYATLKPNENGEVVPTLVVRQIPFSTDSFSENSAFPVTRFLSLPRWVISPSMVRRSDLGRSDATHINMVHVYGEASSHARRQSVSEQMSRNAPIFDPVDIARSGMRPMMRTVNCAVQDEYRIDGARLWMEGIADWTFGSQHTLCGTVEITGVQAPICVGDNVELEGVVYHVEGVAHRCGMEGEQKTFSTTLTLTNGMAADQTGGRVFPVSPDFPLYPGFSNDPTFSSEDPDVLGPTGTDNFGSDPDLVDGSGPGTTNDER